MRYIGPFFRINNISSKEIESQLFYLSKEAIKHITLQSRCGVIASIKNAKKYLSNNDINILKDFSPLLCVYKKGRPKLTSSKHLSSWPEDSFKKEITCSSNALMTYLLLQLVDYYDNFKEKSKDDYALCNIYKTMSKLQLDFYSTYLRNGDGVFLDKKNSSNVQSELNLSDSTNKFKLSDQAFMMNSYYLYWLKCTDDPERDAYKNFSLDILDMFLNFKEKLYDLSFEESSKILLGLNSFYLMYPKEKLLYLLIDLTDYLIDKYDDKNYLFDEVDFSCIFSINLYLSYKNTKMQNFYETFLDISNRHKKLYNIEKSIFIKPNDKKEVKYSSLEISTYLFNMILLNNVENDDRSDTSKILSNAYKSFFVNSGIVLSWPETPSLDSLERYTDFSLISDDLLDENMFRTASFPTIESTNTAPIFIKNVKYSKKKNEFQSSKSSFDSERNMFIFYLILLLFKDDVMKNLFKPTLKDEINKTLNLSQSDENSRNENDIPHMQTEIIEPTVSIICSEDDKNSLVTSSSRDITIK